jgi:TonB-linked SusC/RagA family outer membrane protein
MGLFIILSESVGAQSSTGQQQDQIWRTITGFIKDHEGNPLIGATVTAEGVGVRMGVISSSDGSYHIRLTQPTKALNFSFIGMEPQRKEIGESDHMNVTLYPTENVLEEITVVSSGYFKLPKERVTGAASVITAKELQEIPTINIMERIQDLAPGMYVDPASNSIQIRGINSFGQGATKDPLIVVDGFPMAETDDKPFKLTSANETFTGSSILSMLNPNDIASITVLKDAAASSIWGAKAANGVIVIETKRGRNERPRINFSTSLNFSAPVSVSKLDQMTSAQYIDLEQELFDKGMIKDTSIKDPWAAFNRNPPLSKANEWMFKVRRGTATEAERDAALASLASVNNFSQIRDYLLQNATSQQYNLSISGGGNNTTYFISGNYSKDVPVFKGNKGESMFLTTNIVNNLFDNRVRVTTGFNYNYSNTVSNAAAINAISGLEGLRPYELLKDAQGNNIKHYLRYRKEVIEDFENKGYLDWHYNAIEELDATNYVSQSNRFRFNLDINTKLTSWADFSIQGQLQRDIENGENIDYQSSYVMRNMINYGTTFDSKGKFVYGVPLGGAISVRNYNGWQYVLRTQFNVDKNFGGSDARHNLAFVAGAEFRQNDYRNVSDKYYGFDEDTYEVATVNPNVSYQTIDGWGMTIGSGTANSRNLHRALSYYSNAAFSILNGKYVLSGSLRFDDFTMVGASREQPAQPLWSLGGKWDIKKERFMEDINWINTLALRLTYGVNGTVPMGVGHKAVINLSRDNDTNEKTAYIDSPANSTVTWEKVKSFNVGLDYSTWDNRLSFAIDYYTKKTSDILYNLPFNPTYGWSRLLFNSATMKSHGVDLGVNVNWFRGNFKWNTLFNFGYNDNEVTDSRFEKSDYIAELLGGSRPIVGLPVDYLYAYRWAGLDNKGQSQIYTKDGEILSSGQQMNELDVDDLRYMGRSTPPYFGGLMNSFSYKNFTLGIRLSYSLGHVMRRLSIQNYPTFDGEYSGRIGAQRELALRWQKPVDEAHTNVPGITNDPNQFNSTSRYSNSDLLVISGSHVRLQQINFGYNFPVSLLQRTPFKSLNITGSIRNMGILWRKNKDGVDPNYRVTNKYTNLAPSPAFFISVNTSL